MSEDRKDVYLVVYDPNYNEVARGAKGSNSVSLKGLKPNTTYLEGNFTVVYSSDNGISGHKYLPTFKTQPRLVTLLLIVKFTLCLVKIKWSLLIALNQQMLLIT